MRVVKETYQTLSEINLNLQEKDIRRIYRVKTVLQFNIMANNIRE